VSRPATLYSTMHRAVAAIRDLPHPQTRTDGCLRLRFSRSFKDSESQISPTSASGSRLALSPSSTASTTSQREHRMSDLTNYRRDLAILDPSGGRPSQNHQNNPASSSLSNQIAPWMLAGGSAAGSSTFYNDSTDNLSVTSQQMSPVLRGLTARPSQTTAGSGESPDGAYSTDERRPSIASITTTASSQGSRTSGARGGLRKLQGFFGEEFPGRDSSETSLNHPSGGKEHRSHSHSNARPHRDRNYSNATDHGRDASPSSRPRTPVPAPEVVPFLYQEADVRPMRRVDMFAFVKWSCRETRCRAFHPLLPSLCRRSLADTKKLGHCTVWRSASPRHPERARSRPLCNRRLGTEPTKNIIKRAIGPLDRPPAWPSPSTQQEQRRSEGAAAIHQQGGLDSELLKGP